jgi:hypothetical protein
LNYLF